MAIFQITVCYSVIVIYVLYYYHYSVINCSKMRQMYSQWIVMIYRVISYYNSTQTVQKTKLIIFHYVTFYLDLQMTICKHYCRENMLKLCTILMPYIFHLSTHKHTITVPHRRFPLLIDWPTSVHPPRFRWITATFNPKFNRLTRRCTINNIHLVQNSFQVYPLAEKYLMLERRFGYGGSIYYPPTGGSSNWPLA